MIVSTILSINIQGLALRFPLIAVQLNVSGMFGHPVYQLGNVNINGNQQVGTAIHQVLLYMILTASANMQLATQF